MDVSLFDFELPEERIALRPVSPRDHARLLQVAGGKTRDYQVFDLPDLLRAGDVLVLNDTRVFPAALQGIRPKRAHGGGSDVTIDFNLIKPLEAGRWQAFARPAKRIKTGDIIDFKGELSATVRARQEGLVELEFSKSGEELMQAFERIGQPPLPPYIARKRAVDSRDDTDYQTVFAQQSGSVAAPTAGLHFTQNLLSRFGERGVDLAYLTLHVGAGTFLPITNADTDDHVMHSEWYSLSPKAAQTINQAKSKGGRVIAVGTTALRALESAADDGLVLPGCGETDIFIQPGYTFKIIDGLMTNFHLPKSTLFMLVSALAGLEAMHAAYAYAIDQDYRFYSYGDASLIWAEGNNE